MYWADSVEIDSEGQKHHSFAYFHYCMPSNHTLNPWKFPKIKYCYQVGEGSIFELASLTPWDYKILDKVSNFRLIKVRYGLYSTLVKKLIRENVDLRELKIGIVLDKNGNLANIKTGILHQS